MRFITCGSVDDGKSTLIGRLLWESGFLLDDHLERLEADSRRIGTQGDEIDFALLLDGLAAEREQGITIDVAYRQFQTRLRRFVVADTPGHEQYTRNMATGASTADCAVILADARKGVLTQTLRHTYIVSLLGLRHVVLAVNKMDLAGYGERRFREIAADYRRLAGRIGLAGVECIPISALRGDNVITRGDRMDWYRGPTLLEYLESVGVDAQRMQSAPFRLAVQWVNRPDLDFRGLAGTVAGGAVRPGDRVRILPSNRESEVRRIVTFDGDRDLAVAGEAVTLVLADELDASRGDLVTSAEAPAELSDRIEATVIWMADEPLREGDAYLLRAGTATVGARVSRLCDKTDVNTLEQLETAGLELNEIGTCELDLDRAIAFDRYADNRETGGFVLIDRLTLSTAGAGMFRRPLRRPPDLHWQALDVNKTARAAQKGQRPMVIWLTGLSGAGKSTIANLLEKRLHSLGRHTYLLDGDNVRHGLSRDLGFDPAGRRENIRRVAEVAKLMVDAGLIVIAAFISPMREERELARRLLEPGEFLEVFVDAPLEVAEARDPKGLYKKARAGRLANFTGIDAPYEAPLRPELRIDTTAATPQACADRVAETVIANGGRQAPKRPSSQPRRQGVPRRA